MNIERIQQGKALVRDKYIVGIEPRDKSHKAVIISPAGLPVSKPFGFSVNREGFLNFEKTVLSRIPKEYHSEIIIGLEISCNLWQTFSDYIQQKNKKADSNNSADNKTRSKFTLVNVSPMTTYLARGKRHSNFNKSDNRDAMLIAESVQQSNFIMPIYHEPIYQQIHLLSVYFSKLIDNRIKPAYACADLLDWCFQNF